MSLFLPFLAAVAAATPPPASLPPPPEPRVTRVVVLKAARLLHLLAGDRVIHTYQIALGPNPVGHKERQGDGRTPEGTYILDWRNPNSAFYRSIHISYPNERDRETARRLGVHPGGDIVLHGLPNGLGWLGASHRQRDWTLGCIAVTNEEMDEIGELVPNCTPIEIRP
ncbi:MAG TPA: L,D-transpeptidase family protein [Thermoanaerobaculaceae bacterium]|nr:L,D-transpeptidase family protein [Thermoanaerobaculaceae bacterium]HRS16122.1 L,D-transpeptidase family protein [Thermoanaerobaculaceae bacterium]